jgi:4-amino-4-deoxy-L-arabinose transferase-like glycosyltransferase
MQLSAQLTSALASLLLVVPMFYLGVELFDRRAAFWATVLFQCLPTTGRLLPDGLSEPLFLLFAVTSLVLSMRSLRTGSVLGFLLAGLTGGLAYLTRPEGVLLVSAAGLVLVAAQGVRRWHRPWLRCLACGTALLLGALVVGGPFAWCIGGLTKKNTAEIVIRKLTVNQPRSPVAQPPSHATAGFTPFAAWWNAPDHGPSERTGWALWSLADVLVRGFFYVAWVPALLGLWWFRDRFRSQPGPWVLLANGVPLVAALYSVAVVMGYLSERHTLLILLCGTYWATAAMGLIGDAVASRLSRSRPALAPTPWAQGNLWSAVLLLPLCAFPLLRTLAPLHADRAGFHAAGLWLAGHATLADHIEDPYSWANYYAGRVFLEGQAPTLPTTPSALWYVVLERSSNQHTHLPEVAEAERRAAEGTPVQRWPVRRGKERAEVVVYALPWR